MISSKNKGQQAAKSSLPVLVIGLPVRAVCRGVQNTPVFFELSTDFGALPTGPLMQLGRIAVKQTAQFSGQSCAVPARYAFHRTTVAAILIHFSDSNAQISAVLCDPETPA